MRRDGQQELTSPTLKALIRRGLAQRLKGAFDPSASKTELLTMLLDEAGPTAVVELGLEMRHIQNHPVINALFGGRSGLDVLRRWLRLERFGHSTNRTEIVDTFDEGPRRRVVLRHVAIDGSAIDVVNDLFIWGLIIALVERAGFAAVRGSLPQRDQQDVVLYDGGAQTLAVTPQESDVCSISWDAAEPRAPAVQAPSDDVSTVGQRLQTLFANDLLRSWRVAESAKSLGVSSRQLQRQLAAERTTFSETLHRTRVSAAQRMITTTRLSLTEIAYCSGFSDSAHFTRLFRRYADVPPSALRDLASASSAQNS